MAEEIDPEATPAGAPAWRETELQRKRIERLVIVLTLQAFLTLAVVVLSVAVRSVDVDIGYDLWNLIDAALLAALALGIFRRSWLAAYVAPCYYVINGLHHYVYPGAGRQNWIGLLVYVGIGVIYLQGTRALLDVIYNFAASAKSSSAPDRGATIQKIVRGFIGGTILSIGIIAEKPAVEAFRASRMSPKEAFLYELTSLPGVKERAAADPDGWGVKLSMEGLSDLSDEDLVQRTQIVHQLLSSEDTERCAQMARGTIAPSALEAMVAELPSQLEQAYYSIALKAAKTTLKPETPSKVAFDEEAAVEAVATMMKGLPEADQLLVAGLFDAPRKLSDEQICKGTRILYAATVNSGDSSALLARTLVQQ